MDNVGTFEQYLRENRIFSRYNLTRIGVFGSFAREEENPNDIDILIEDEVDWEKLLELRSVLESAFGKKVDMVLKKFANPIIMYRAEKDMRYVTEH